MIHLVIGVKKINDQQWPISLTTEIKKATGK